MKQDFNLLNDLPKWEKSLYPFNLLITILILFISLLMIFYYFTYLEFIHKSKIITALTIQQKAATKRLNTLQQKILSRGSYYKNIEQAQQTIFDNTIKYSGNGSKSLYAILETLGNEINPSVWLNNIDISQTEKHINLAGYTIQPQNAMSYVTDLNQTSLFATTPFKLENIKKISNQQYLYIQLATQNNKQGEQ